MSNTTLNVPKDVLEPIIKAHMTAALAEALGSREQVLNAVVAQILNATVDSDGKPSNYSHDRQRTYIEWLVRKALTEAVSDVVKENLALYKDRVQEALVAELKKKNSPLIRDFLAAMLKGAGDAAHSYRFSVEVQER